MSMKEGRTLWLIFLSLLLIGCTSSKEETESTLDGQLIKRQFYEDGTLLSEGIFINDTIKNGWYRVYGLNGKLSFEEEYKNGLKNGYRIKYDEQGNIESKTFFKNGLPNGKSYWYYKDGKLESESTWIDGKQFGGAVFYYPNGNLKKYTATDFEEHTRYIRWYDEEGNFVKEQGTVLGQLLLINTKGFDSLKIGQEVVVNICAAQPPDTETIVFIGELDSINNIKNQKMYPIVDGVVSYKKTYNTSGKYTWISIGQMEDIKTGVIKTDTIYTDISIR